MSGIIGRPRLKGGRSAWRRSRLGFIPSSALRPALLSGFAGTHAKRALTLPVSWINGGGARVVSFPPSNRRNRPARLNPYTRVSVQELRNAGRRGYARIGPNRWVRADRVRTARLRPRPPGVAPAEKWIHVNLAEWTLVAYVGKRPVFATMVSTGNNTPPGKFRITKKMATAILGHTTKDGMHEVEGVPWVAYFKPRFAFHSAYWHDFFGFVESSGCVNLSPTDARWLFEWSSPKLPPGWYTVHPTRTEPGTFVLIE